MLFILSFAVFCIEIEFLEPSVSQNNVVENATKCPDSSGITKSKSRKQEALLLMH